MTCPHRPPFLQSAPLPCAWPQCTAAGEIWARVRQRWWRPALGVMGMPTEYVPAKEVLIDMARFVRVRNADSYAWIKK